MGVLGLLPQLRGYTHEVHISKYAGQVVAVDGYAWLHRGVHACAPELGCGGQSEKHIAWCLARVALLLHYGVKPLLVFDGAPLPAKAAQEMVRRERREAAKQQALQCVREGRHDEARKHFAKSIDVTPLMAAAFIDACVGRWQGRVDFVVAPYEADAQLAWLARSGECVAVISEDSDNLPYGVPRALFKLQADGTASEIELDRLFDAASARGDSLDFTGWSRSMFVLMCCFAGCDYVDAVRGVGIKGAYRLVQRHREAGRVLRALRYEFGAAVPADYEAALTRALLTYSHQRVFCRRTRSAVSLAPSAASDGVVLDLDSMDFLGRPLPDAVATGIAHCLLDPETFAPLERPRPSATLAACSLQRATCDLKQKNTLENYFAARPPSVDETRSARRVDEDDDDATAATAQSKSTTAARTPRCAAAVDASSKRRRAAPSARWSRTPASLFDARPPVTVLDEADSDASLCAAPSSRVASGRASKFFRAADTENAENTENADRDAEGFVPPRPFGANEKAPLMQKYAAPAAASSRRLRCAAVSRPPAPASVLRRAATPDAEDEDDENGAPVKVMTARPLCLDAPVAARHLCLDAYRFNASSPRFNASSPHTAAGGSYETSLSPSRSATPRGAHETPGGAYETSLSPPRSAQSPRSPQSRASGRSSDARPPERGELGVSLFAKFAYAAAAGAT